MAHWSDHYVGQPFVLDEKDCAWWAEEILRRQFGRTVCLPTDRAGGHRGKARQIQEALSDYCHPTDTTAEGDAVIMVSRGALYHIGLYAEIGGRPWVVHAAQNAGQVVRTRLRDLEREGLVLEGIYRWK